MKCCVLLPLAWKEATAAAASVVRVMFRDQTILEDKYIREYAFEPELLIKRDNNNNNKNENDQRDADRNAINDDHDRYNDHNNNDDLNVKRAELQRNEDDPITISTCPTITSRSDTTPSTCTSPSVSSSAFLTSNYNENCVRRYSGDIYDEIYSRNQVDLEIEAFYYVSWDTIY